MLLGVGSQFPKFPGAVIAAAKASEYGVSPRSAYNNRYVESG